MTMINDNYTYTKIGPKFDGGRKNEFFGIHMLNLAPKSIGERDNVFFGVHILKAP